MLPVQVDAWYRSGASGIAISVASLALATGALASLLLRLTGSLTAALTGAALIILNPNVLYLQSTPMTEPLLFGLSFLAVAATARWLDNFPVRTPSAAGATLAAACLTRARGMGDHRRRHCARQRTVAAARASGSRDSARQCVARTLAGHSHYRLHDQQPLGCWRLVRHGRNSDRRRSPRSAIRARRGARSMRDCGNCPVALWCGPVTRAR